MNTQANWWQSFFHGVAVDMWLKALPPEHTAREADALAVPVGAEVLDVPCGAGRLSLALAPARLHGALVSGEAGVTTFLVPVRGFAKGWLVKFEGIAA